MIAFLIKASIILSVFFVFYKIFLERESFFAKNRLYLLISLLFSFTLPFVTLPDLIKDQGFVSKIIEKYIYEAPSPKTIDNNPEIENLDKEDSEIATSNSLIVDNVIDKGNEINADEDNVISPDEGVIQADKNTDGAIYSKNNTTEKTSRGFLFWLLLVYFFGALVLSINLVAQIGNVLFRAIKSKDKIEDFKCIIINSPAVTEPCSFFNYIFINPESYDYETYEQILAHEKIHVKKFHTIDLLLSEIGVIFLWFNPVIWLFRKEVEKNIEFQTDNLLLNEKTVEREDYQMSLLKIATYQRPLTITTNYNQSLIKQRILKMSAKKSNPYSYWKYAFVAPIIFSILLIVNKPTNVIAQAENEDLAFVNVKSNVASEKYVEEKEESTMSKDSLETIRLNGNKKEDFDAVLKNLESLSKEEKLRILKALKELDTEQILSKITNSKVFENLEEEDRLKTINDLENLKKISTLSDIDTQQLTKTEVKISVSDDSNPDMKFEDLEPEVQSDVVEALKKLEGLQGLGDLSFLEDLKKLENINGEELIYNINPATKVIVTEGSSSSKESDRSNTCKVLINAIRKGDIGKVKELLKMMNPNCVDPTIEYEELIVNGETWTVRKPRTPMVAAARFGKVEIGELLINANAEIDFHGNNEESPLIAASTYGHTEFVAFALKNGADVNIKTQSYGTALHWAASNGHIKIMALLLENGADIDAMNNGQGSALNAAARNGQNRSVEFLLKKGANIDAMTNGQGSALNAAARNGKNETVKLLLDNGADINAMTNGQGSALNAAARNGNSETVKLLLDRGADIDAMNNGQGSALNAAARNGKNEIVKLLLDNGADVNAMTNGQGSALNAASRNGKNETVKLLLERGADINAMTNGQGSALNAASRNGENETVKLLLDKGADINAASNGQGSALNAAARNGHLEIVKLLVSRGADVNAYSRSHGSALDSAKRNGHKNVMKYLISQGAKR